MSMTQDLEKMAVEKMITEARETSARLGNGSGVVASCPAHTDIAHGVRLCLDLLVCLLMATGTSRRNGAWSAAGTLATLIVWKIAETVLAKHGVSVPIDGLVGGP